MLGRTSQQEIRSIRTLVRAFSRFSVPGVPPAYNEPFNTYALGTKPRQLLEEALVVCHQTFFVI